MGYLRFYVFFNSISVILGRWTGGNERLCAMESRLRLKRCTAQSGLEPRSARSANRPVLNPLSKEDPNSQGSVLIHIRINGYTFRGTTIPFQV